MFYTSYIGKLHRYNKDYNGKTTIQHTTPAFLRMFPSHPVLPDLATSKLPRTDTTSLLECAHIVSVLPTLSDTRCLNALADFTVAHQCQDLLDCIEDSWSCVPSVFPTSALFGGMRILPRQLLIFHPKTASSLQPLHLMCTLYFLVRLVS